MSGNDRIKFFNDVQYFYNMGSFDKCYKHEEVIYKNKAKAQIPLKRLESL